MTDQMDAGIVAGKIAEDPDALSQPYAGGELGRGRRRKEDAKLVTGQTNWTDNIVPLCNTALHLYCIQQ